MSTFYHDSSVPATKVCSQCHKEKPLTEFYRQSNLPDGHKKLCKACCKNTLHIDNIVQLPLCFEVKQCNKCLEMKPLDQFAIQKEGKMGRASYCKDCFSARHKERYSKHVPLPDVAPGNKLCRKCLVEKPLTEFSRQANSRDKYNSQCKACVSYRQYVVNREQSLARMKRAYEQNKEHYRATQRKNYEENKERYTAYVRQWQQENYLHVREWHKRRKARIRGTTVEPVSYEQILERDGMWCHICEQPIEEHHKLQFDHVIPLARNGTHTMENIRPAHDICNQRKYDKLMEELTSFDRRGPD